MKPQCQDAHLCWSLFICCFVSCSREKNEALSHHVISASIHKSWGIQVLDVCCTLFVIAVFSFDDSGPGFPVYVPWCCDLLLQKIVKGKKGTERQWRATAKQFRKAWSRTKNKHTRQQELKKTKQLWIGAKLRVLTISMVCSCTFPFTGVPNLDQDEQNDSDHTDASNRFECEDERWPAVCRHLGHIGTATNSTITRLRLQWAGSVHRKHFFNLLIS